MAETMPGAAPSTAEGGRFQPDPEVIRWRLRLRSEPGTVYRALATPEGRRDFWALRQGSGTGPRTWAPVRFAVLTISRVDVSSTR